MTRAPVDVRRATVDDVDDLTTLWARAREELGLGSRTFGCGAFGGTTIEQLSHRIEVALEGGGMQVVLARWTGQPVGYALMRLIGLTPFLDGPALHVEHLFVTPAFRRHGVARALLAAVAATAERQGVDQIVTNAPPSSRDTHRYLARLGFSPLVVRRVAGTAVLRRRLAGENRRGALEDLLSRRRSMRARTGRGTRRGAADLVDELARGEGLGGRPATPPGDPMTAERAAAEYRAPDTMELPKVGARAAPPADPAKSVRPAEPAQPEEGTAVRSGESAEPGSGEPEPAEPAPPAERAAPPSTLVQGGRTRRA